MLARLLNEINLIANRKFNTKPVFHIYTTGLANDNVRNRWNKYLYKWLLNKLGDKYILEINHYDIFNEKNIPNDNGIVHKIFLDLSIHKFEYPFVLFEFSHELVTNYTGPDKDELSSHSVYIPYLFPEDPFVEFGLEPFVIKEDGKIKTYIDQLAEGDYKVVERKYIIKADQRKEGQIGDIEIPYKTIEFQGKTFDTDDKLDFLYDLIVWFNIIDLAKNLDIKDNDKKCGGLFEFRKSINTNSDVSVKFKFTINLTKLINIVNCKS